MNNDVVLKLYEKYAQDIFRFAYSYLNSYSDAQDVVHEVFLKLLKSNIRITEGKEKSYILKMAANNCKDLLKSKNHSAVISFDELPSSAEAYEDDFKDNELTAALKKIPENYRIVIHLHYYEELSVKETAKILKLSVSCVSMRLTRAKEMLREALKEYSYEEIL